MRNRHKALLGQKTIFWGQRAKSLCLSKGDQNSNYFHTSVKIRRYRNRIKAIKNDFGVTFTEHSDIVNCFSDFYHKLWSTSSNLNQDSLFNMIPDDYPILSEEDRAALIKSITKREVYRTLSSMPRGKSPGPDGLNVEFYVFYWNIIGDHFFQIYIPFFF